MNKSIYLITMLILASLGNMQVAKNKDTFKNLNKLDYVKGYDTETRASVNKMESYKDCIARHQKDLSKLSMVFKNYSPAINKARQSQNKKLVKLSFVILKKLALKKNLIVKSSKSCQHQAEASKNKGKLKEHNKSMKKKIVKIKRVLKTKLHVKDEKNKIECKPQTKDICVKKHQQAVKDIDTTMKKLKLAMGKNLNESDKTILKAWWFKRLAHLKSMKKCDHMTVKCFYGFKLVNGQCQKTPPGCTAGWELVNGSCVKSQTTCQVGYKKDQNGKCIQISNKIKTNKCKAKFVLLKPKIKALTQKMNALKKISKTLKDKNDPIFIKAQKADNEAEEQIDLLYGKLKDCGKPNSMEKSKNQEKQIEKLKYMKDYDEAAKLFKKADLIIQKALKGRANIGNLRRLSIYRNKKKLVRTRKMIKKDMME